MCFSATASFTAGAALIGLGAYTVGRARWTRALPYAAIPLLFGIQQSIEGLIWLSFDGDMIAQRSLLTFLYSLFSHVWWPMYVPLAVWVMEPSAQRRTVLLIVTAVGWLIGAYLLVSMLRFPIVAQAIEGHIAYLTPHFYEVAVMSGSLLATGASMLFSSYWTVRLFGVAALIAFTVSYLAYTQWLISVWCFSAAALSVLVALHFKRASTTVTNRSCRPIDVSV